MNYSGVRNIHLIHSDVTQGAQAASALGGTLKVYVQSMRNAKMSEITIRDRVELLTRLEEFLGIPLLEATGDDLYRYQSTYAHLAPATVDIYTRHIRALYRWAYRTDRLATDIGEHLILPRIHRGRPHPTSFDDLRTILACAREPLRTTYILAAFAGLRCGEVCRLHSREVDRENATALIHGKGGKQRTVPLLGPVMSEIGYRRGWIITTFHGRPVTPDRLSSDSSRFLHDLGMATTLHSMRGTFATAAARITHDPLLVRDLLGHDSVATTEIYMESSLIGAHAKLAKLEAIASGLLYPTLASA